MLTARRWLINCRLRRMNQCIRYMSTEGGNVSNIKTLSEDISNDEVSAASESSENPAVDYHNNVELDSERLRAIRAHLESPAITIDTTVGETPVEISHLSDAVSNHVIEELAKEHCHLITEEAPNLEQMADLVKEIIAEEPSIIEHVALPTEAFSEAAPEMEELLAAHSSEQFVEESVQATESIKFEPEVQLHELDEARFAEKAHFVDQDYFEEEGARFGHQEEEGGEEFSYAAEQYQRSEEMIQRYIRVDHAGEVAANFIYAGQLAVLGRTKEAPIIQHMWDQEKVHRDKFNELIVSERVRPTAMLPVWQVAAFALGAGTALLGKEAAMACTVAVEDTIVSHYTNQIRTIIKEGKEEKYKDLLDTFKKFRDEELEHHDTGIKHDAELAPQYKILSTVIAAGCSAAIKISEKI